MGAWRRGGAFCNGIVCTACRGGCFFRMKVCKRIFGSRWWSPSAGRSHRRVTACTPTRRGKVCCRLSASRRLCRVQSRHGSPPRRSFCSYKRNQNTLGAVPQDPLAAKLRLDTNDAKASSVQRRRYALKVPAAHFILEFAGTELKINLISVVASDATSA